MKLQRAWAFLSVCVLSVCLFSGCKKGQTEKSPTDENGKYTPEITVTSAAIFPLVDFPEGQSYEDNVWLQEYKEKLGINLKYDWYVTDNGSWYQRINVAIKSGELPDFFKADVEQFRLLQNSGSLADLTEAYESTASDALKALLYESGPTAMASATVDGKLLGIPFTEMPKEGAPILMIRKDWMDRLNLEAPKTFDDVKKIAAAFVNNDPDGNGVDDTIGIGLDNNIFFNTSSTAWQGMNAAFGVQPTIWVKNGEGKLEYGSVQPKMRDYLIALSDMYKQNLLYKDILKVDFSGLETQIINEKCGLYFQPFHAPANALQVLHNLTPEAEWAYYPIPTVDGSKPQIPVGSGVNCYWVVRDGFRDPEAIIKMLNMYVDYQYGTYETEEELERIGKGMMEGKDGNLWKMAAVQAFKGFNNLERYHLMNDYLKNGVEPPLNYKSLATDIKSYLDNGDESKWWTNQIYGVGGCLGIIEQYKADDQYITDQYYGPKTETYASSWGDLFSMEQTTFMEIVTGQKTISEFDKFVEDWRRKGGDKITEEINAWYESVQ